MSKPTKFERGLAEMVRGDAESLSSCGLTVGEKRQKVACMLLAANEDADRAMRTAARDRFHALTALQQSRVFG